MRFVREQSLRVVHPHVVAPAGWAAEDEQVLLTMELVRGGDVARLLGDYGALPLSFAAVLVDQLLDALTAVHSHGIVHRDVKPSNLLLEPTGRNRPVLRLADFGIAAVLGEPRLTSAGLAVGSPGYVAPERLLGAPPDVREDIYGVGVVCCRLLTGQPPSPEVLRSLPKPLRALVSAMCAQSPDDRPESAAIAREEWRNAVERAGAEPIDPADPHAIEVFEHVAPLPEGYGPDGPLTPPAPTAPSAPAAEPSRRARRALSVAGALVLAAGLTTSIILSTKDHSSSVSQRLGHTTTASSTTTRTTTGTTRTTTSTTTSTTSTTTSSTTTSDTSAPAEDNLLSDPGAEKVPAAWTSFGSGVVSQVNAPRSGTKALRITSSAEQENSAGATTKPAHSPTVASTTYHAACWVQSLDAVGAILQIQEYTADWKRVADPAPSPKVVLDPGEWNRVSVTYTARQSGNQLPVTVFSNNLRDGAGALFVDDCSLTAG